MDVRCERCKAHYQFEDDQVGPAGLTVQCTHCKHVFLVKKKELVVTLPLKLGQITGKPFQAGVTPSRPSPASASDAADPSAEYRIRLASGQVFPCRDLTTLQKWIVERRVGRDDEVAPPGETYKRFRELHDLDTFFEIVDAADQAAAAPASPPPAQSAPLPRRTTRVTAVSTPIQMDQGLPLDADLDASERAAVGGGHALRNTAIAVVLLGAAAAGVWFLAPGLVSGLFAKPPSPDPGPGQEAAAPVPTPPPEPVKEKPPEPVPAVAAVPDAKPAEPPPAAPAPVTPPPPKGPKALIAQAERLRDKGDYEKALDLYDRAVELAPDNADALAGRGLCYLDLEQYESAATAFKEALRVDPENEDAMVGVAEAYRSLGRAAEAIKHYEKYLAAYPDGEEAPVARNALEQLRR